MSERLDYPNKMQEFVELDRCFIPVTDSDEISIDVGRVWGKRVFGWESWADLCNRPRVVVLAEAGSGKTWEFERCAERLRSEGVAAFFIRVEDLADTDLERCLSHSDRRLLDAWLLDKSTGHFFLDSVDEAKLNGRKLHHALRNLSRSLGGSLNRAHIVLSCRVSDWGGRGDLEEIRRWLPFVPHTDEGHELSPESRLLAPVFEERVSNRAQKKKHDTPRHEIHVVQLAPLFRDERRKLVTGLGIIEVDAFEEAIYRHGLEGFADRPRDVVALVNFWKDNGKFASLTEMTAYTVDLRLSEQDHFRPDNGRVDHRESHERR